MTSLFQLVRIGSRPSPMAVAQVDRVACELSRMNPFVSVQRVTVSTTGDTWTGPLAEAGGKGAFVRELDQAQLAGAFDIGMHCLKDVPGDVALPAGLTIAAFLAREDVRDAVVSHTGAGLDALPAGAAVATSSPRRAAQIQRRWPALQVVPIRGNTDTRIRKLDDGTCDALVLAVAGLRRLGLESRITAILDPSIMLPAVGAGVIALTVRTNDPTSASLAARLADAAATRAVLAERAMLKGLGGHCLSAIGGYATAEPDGTLRLRGGVYAPNGNETVEVTESGPADQPEQLGHRVAELLLDKGAGILLAARPV